MSEVKHLCLIALLIVTATSMLPISRVSGTTFATGSSSPKSIEQQFENEVSSMDSSRAISLATHSPAFRADTDGGLYAFNSIYETFHSFSTPNGVNVNLNTVNVVYSHRTKDGTSTNVVATEDPALTRVTEVTIQHGVRDLSYITYPTWDGYEFSMTGRPFGTNVVLEAWASWTVPQAISP